MTGGITPEVVSAIAKAIVSNAERLGLTWTLRIATVINPVTDTGGSFVAARYDGDEATINMVNMMEVPLENGARVYAIRVPPGGNYIVGAAVATPLGMAVYNNVDSGNPATGTTTSASYSDMPGPMELTVRKKFNSTKLLLAMGGTWVDTAGSAGTTPRFGIEIAGASFGDGDYHMSMYHSTLPAGVVRHVFPTMERLVEVGMGNLTLTARWLRFTGAGTIGVFIADDILYMKAQETWD